MKHLNLTKTVIALIALSCLMALTPAKAGNPNYYGAIAISPSSKAMGWSYDFRSKWKAERAALARCRQHASDCRIATWFRNACGAVAVGHNGGWGAHWGASVKNANWRAKKTCNKHDSYCEVKRWVCTTRY